ncbi:MAG: hypothetical protein IKX51_03000 [Bacteroidales bacterium]|nr:hypothetical protein [Bacteroidales bacterium]
MKTIDKEELQNLSLEDMKQMLENKYVYIYYENKTIQQGKIKEVNELRRTNDFGEGYVSKTLYINNVCVDINVIDHIEVVNLRN